MQDGHPSCRCNKIYSPYLDLQRYCGQCMEWFHASCATLIEPEGPPDSTKSERERMRSVPIMRGWDGAGEGMAWETVGNWRRLMKFRAWDGKSEMEAEWQTKLGQAFVVHVLSKTWAIYQCPQCSTSM